MMNNGFDGVSMKGQWVNRRTGSTVNVRDNFIGDDGMMIMTDKGMISMKEFSRDYIQMSEEFYDNSGHVINNYQPSESVINNDNTVTFNDAQRELLLRGLGDSHEETVNDNQVIQEDSLDDEQPQETQNSYLEPEIHETNDVNSNSKTLSVVNTNNDLLDKLFSKIDSKPKITISIKWAEYPITELNVLKTYFDVSDNDIADYLTNNFVTEDNIKNALSVFLKTKDEPKKSDASVNSIEYKIESKKNKKNSINKNDK